MYDHQKFEKPPGVEREPAIHWRGVSGFPTWSEARRGEPRTGIVDVVGLLEPGGSVSVVHRVSSGPVSLRTTVAVSGGGTRADAILNLAFPSARFAPTDFAREPFALSRRVVPRRFDLESDGKARLVPVRATSRRDVDSEIPIIASRSGYPPDIETAIRILGDIDDVELELGLHSFAVDARLIRGLSRLKERLAARADRRGGEDDAHRALMGLVSELQDREEGVLMKARLLTAVDPGSAILDIVSLAVFGLPADHELSEEPYNGDDAIDLRGVWQATANPPRLLPSADAVKAMPSRTSASVAAAPVAGGLTLGRDAADGLVGLTGYDRARHLFVIGGTGTGKSTLILNLLAQDFASGEGVILVDPHGDLADDARALIPRHRRRDLIFADAADGDGAYALDMLAGCGRDPALERNFVANGLIRLFSLVLYAGVPEAFGPMFETYFRNALLLLMEANGHDACLLDFEAIFFDDDVRRRMLSRCEDKKVVEFWSELATKITHDEIKLINIAPYVTSKLAQLTGNPLIRRIVAGKGPGIDFAAAMNERKIVILKIAKGVVGASDAELIAALTVQKIAQACMGRASLANAARQPSRLYVDEFQTCVGEGLAELLAESRKYGLSMVLATQSLGQIDGTRRRPDTGAAALANAANLVAFRLGAPDAVRLGPWFAPDVEWADLCRLPDFHAFARVLDFGRPAPAAMLRMAEPPVGPG